MQFPLGRTSAVITAMLCTSPLGAAGTEYTFTKIEVPQASFIAATGLNDSGTAVGWYINGTGMHPFVWRGGSFLQTDFSAPNVTFVGAYGINQAGVIVGDAKANGISQGSSTDELILPTSRSCARTLASRRVNGVRATSTGMGGLVLATFRYWSGDSVRP